MHIVKSIKSCGRGPFSL